MKAHIIVVRQMSLLSALQQPRQLYYKYQCQHDYSTVTLFARLRGWSTSVPLIMAT